jgi:hypothetical protein
MQVIVESNGNILYASNLFSNLLNNEHSLFDDAFINSIECGLLHNVTYAMYDNKGLPVQCSGGYLLGKNNDRMKTFLLSPTTTSISSQSEACYIDFYKSIHEEITATFDTMKFRWRILTENFHSYSMSFVQDIVHTCCILHNMCLSFDDLHYFDWEEAHPNTTDNDIYLSETSCTETTISLHDVDVLQTTPSSKRRSYLVQKKSHYQKLNDDLLKHFQHQYANKLLCFPKRFSRELKIKHSSDLNYHITRSSGPVLYIKESTIKYGIKNVDGCLTYIGNCGKGLFSRNFIRKNEYIATFIGIEVELTKKQLKEESSVNGYLIHYAKNTYLNCQQHRRSQTCIASFANTATNAFHISPYRPAINNAGIRRDYNNRRINLVSTTDILPDTEILLPYGKKYKCGLQIID